jgi:PEP-CTERM motif
MTCTTFHRLALISTVSSFIVSPAAFAGESGDYGVNVENNTLTTWLADDTTGLIAPERVFATDLVDLGGVITIDEPGFFAEPGLPIAGAKLGFRITSALGLWDVGGQTFGGISPITMTLDNPLLGSVTTPATNSTVQGPPWVVPVDGFDFHFDFILNGSTPGIYLLEMTLFTDATGIADSQKFWTVFNYDLSETEHDAAIDWVEQNLVPAPSSLALLAFGGLVAWRRRR